MDRTLLLVALAAFIVSLLIGCTSVPTGMERIFLDSTTRADNLPSWAKSTKQVEDDGDTVIFYGSQSIQGTERVNAGCTLAKLNAKEALLTEIAHDIRSSIDQAQQSISEDAELLLGQVRSAEIEGRVVGFRFTDVYFERYMVAQVERIDCYVRGQISKTNYNFVKRGILSNVINVDPELRKAITDKQINFFKRGE